MQIIDQGLVSEEESDAARKQRKDLEEKLRDIEEKLHESKANSKQTEKEARTRELIEEMKGIYTGETQNPSPAWQLSKSKLKLISSVLV